VGDIYNLLTIKQLKMDVGKAKDMFILKMKSKNFSVNTIDNYAAQIDLFLRQFKTYPKAKEISADKIEVYLLNISNINTRKHARCAINSFYKLVINQPNKLQFIPNPKKEFKLVEYITAEEANSLIASCTNLKHKTIMCLAFGCGLRVSEIINLKPKNIDSSRMIINIIQAKGKKDRQVQLPQQLLDLLRNYWKEYTPNKPNFIGTKIIDIELEELLNLINHLNKELDDLLQHLNNIKTENIKNKSDINKLKQLN
jgi:integrase